MAVSPLISICRPKHQQMLCFAECSDLTAVAFSLPRSDRILAKKRSKTCLKMPRKKKNTNGKITFMLYQVLLRFPQIRATVLLFSRLS